MFADVSFPISSWKTFTYSVPSDFHSIIQIGCRVIAPLGNRRKVQGVVVGINKTPKFKGGLQPIYEIMDDTPILDETLWKLICWVSNYYLTPLGQVVRSAVPSEISRDFHTSSILKVNIISKDKRIIEKLEKTAPRQYEIYQTIYNLGGSALLKNISNVYPTARTICRILEKKKLISIDKVSKEPTLENLQVNRIRSPINLTKAQQNIANKIMSSIQNKDYSPYLLHGVTGSGKTEIYIHLAKEIEKLDKTSIILLPEIALTPQIAGRFYSTFKDRIAVWHSRMTGTERSWVWRQICGGKYSVIVGARSAVFTPMKNLGLIVVDEEQESSFKQQSPAPRYHARDVALMRAKISNAVAILSGATPSLESFYNQFEGKLEYLQLSSRFGNAIYPKVHVVDLKKERKKRENHSIIFSQLLSEKIADRLDRKEQIILLQNRRGFSPVLICENCEEIQMCFNCQITLTFHKSENKVKCHYCDYCKPFPVLCRQCTGVLRLGGTGTQKVEEILLRMFPGVKCLRMDLDTTRRKGSYTSILNQFSSGEYDILLGTQMIAKGLDFPNVTLVGVVNADTGLFLPDFRAGERTFQLIYQVAGRSGRGNKPGEAVIQTSYPDDPAIKFACQLDIENYYKVCMNEREELMYPPFSWMARLELSGLEQQGVKLRAMNLAKDLQEKTKLLEIIGPAPCPLERIRGRFRYQVILKSRKDSDKNGQQLRGFLENNFRKTDNKYEHSGVKINVDVDPVSLL
ncbi:MAG: primosomal protein N' [Candidatus Marinimicrobia bacterium]|nr:primosomal protein N' [Candidatus Neomarinimicrobiota bacterium]|tara:strand:+ start:40877 stop:43108 length:2232 start_codon:yes stop_codon:yes gene_type:complete